MRLLCPCCLIPDWRDAWRFLSVQAAAVLALLSAAYEYLPDLHAYLPDGWVKWAALAVIVARLIRQREPPRRRKAAPVESTR